MHDWTRRWLHLMLTERRSVRSVSTNFGFAFGSSSVPTSSDATPTREVDEPSAKRRKTLLVNEITLVEPQVENLVEAMESKKFVKSRRRFPVEDEDMRPQQSPDDSFVAVFGSKKFASKKIENKSKRKTKVEHVAPIEDAIELVEPRAATTGRPRRRAAATAALRVTAGLEEEARPVDKKRGDPKLAKRTAQPRGKNLVNDTKTAREGTDDHQLDNTSAAPNEAFPKKRAHARKRKVSNDDNTAQQIVGSTISDDGEELAASVAVRRYENHAIHVDGLGNWEPTSKLGSRSKSKRPAAKTRKRESSAEAAVQTLPSAQHLRDHAQANSAKDAKLMASETVVGEPRTKRQPLAQTDMNVAMLPASPEKTMQKLSNPATNTNRKSRHQAKTLKIPARRPENKQRKLNVKLDTDATVDQTDGTSSQLTSAHHPELEVPEQSSLGWAAKTSPRDADHRQDVSTFGLRRANSIHEVAKPKPNAKALSFRQISAERNIQNIDVDIAGLADYAHPTGPPSSTAPLPRVTKNIKHGMKGEDKIPPIGGHEEEDVDWLFEPQLQAHLPKLKGAKSKSGSRQARTSKFKMPEVDLDDLLSNIAIFAQEKPRQGIQETSLLCGRQRTGLDRKSRKARV